MLICPLLEYNGISSPVYGIEGDIVGKRLAIIKKSEVEKTATMLILTEVIKE